jgi:hypothetical protein
MEQGLGLLDAIDKLDDLVMNAKGVPMTDQVRLDREKIFALLDAIRVAIPTELKRAASGAALEEAKLRYARGEITRDEFQTLQSDLGAAPPA